MMRFSLVFLLEIRVKDLVRTMCDARLICSEINVCTLVTLTSTYRKGKLVEDIYVANFIEG